MSRVGIGGFGSALEGRLFRIQSCCPVWVHGGACAWACPSWVGVGARMHALRGHKTGALRTWCAVRCALRIPL